MCGQLDFEGGFQIWQENRKNVYTSPNFE